MRILVAPVMTDALLARSTVRSAGRAAPRAAVTVLDVGGGYAPLGDEAVLRPADLGLAEATLHRAAAELDAGQLGRWLAATALVGLLERGDDAVVLLRPGVELLASPDALVEAAAATGLCLVPRLTAVPADGLAPDLAELVGTQLVDPALSVWRGAALPAARVLADAARDWRVLGRELDVAASGADHALAPVPSGLLSAWGLAASTDVAERDGALQADGAPVVALDLSAFDHRRPWVLDPARSRGARALLSEHPALARACAAVAAERAADDGGDAPGVAAAGAFARTAAGWPAHPHLRAMYRRRSARTGAAGIPDDAPDPFDPEGADRLRAWLLAPLPAGHPQPVSRYLADAYALRPDLRDVYPLVPGQDTDALLRWAAEHAPGEADYDPDLLAAAVAAARDAAQPEPEPAPGPEPEPAPPADGVAVVGYLAGELGVGESARLVLAALDAGGVPHATVPVAHQLQSRQQARYVASPQRERFATTLLCVNADQTPGLTRSLGGRFSDTYRVGMWYWEVEDFPAEQHAAFAHVDEVWAATDFIRDALARHSPVPVVTVPPPLPQRPDRPLPPAPLPAWVGDRPVVLFAFDFLSNAERKNPWAAVEAFRRAFRPDEGPVLVLKSINAAADVPSAERLRLLVADRPDVLLLEDYLDADERDALMARCAVYLSLHRSEGLGLTVAEAMAWGRPVVATGYSGNLQFMTPDNSVLVPWTPTRVPEGCAPYPAGTLWADPDVEAAAAALRRVVDEPAWAAALGARAADDVRTRHSPAAAAVRIRERLDEIAALDPRRVPAPGRGGLVGRARRALSRGNA
jgi:glycosyltransferase involved in cell wall biosynthesis